MNGEPADASPQKPGRVRWRTPHFNRFWAAHAVSTFGTSFTQLAVPFVAILVLDLDSFQIGLLASASVAPVVVLGPFFGSLVDRCPRKRVMIWCDVIRSGLIVTIPILIAAHAVTFLALIIVSGAVSVLSAIFRLAQESTLPEILPDEHLGYGNSRIEATESAAEISAPGVAGWLVGVAGSASALLVDSASYLVSAVLLSRVQMDRNEQVSSAESSNGDSAEVSAPSSVWADVTIGFRLLWENSVLRPVSISYAALVLFAQLQMSVYVVFLVRDLDLSPSAIGLIFSASAVVGMLAAILAGRLVANHGAGPLTVVGQGLTVVGAVLLALVAGSVWQAGLTMVSV